MCIPWLSPTDAGHVADAFAHFRGHALRAFGLALDGAGDKTDQVIICLSLSQGSLDVYFTVREKTPSEMAFRAAGAMAFREAARKAAPVILEPVMKVEVVIPSDFFGDVIGDLSARRGKIEETEDRLNMKIIEGTVPLSEMFGYATTLRSLTEGRGNFTMEFDHYEQVPGNIAQEIVEGKRQ